MMSRGVVELVIWFYLFVCVMLMVFNLLYIARSSYVARRQQARVKHWKSVMGPAARDFVMDRRQFRVLCGVNQLVAFHAALMDLGFSREELGAFFCRNASQVQQIAVAFGRKSTMEKAFMAYFIATFHCPDAPNSAMLAEIMLSYLDDSTVYCRENVMQALCALGDYRAIEHALDILNERGWYHSPRLLTDGMMGFEGNKEQLVLHLWRNRAEWEESIVVAMVQLGSLLSYESVDEAFLQTFLHEDVMPEVRFALVRYFQQHPREEVRATLLRYLGEDDALAIVAATALGSYSGEDVKAALMQALTSGNWYVRHNAAQSLVRLGLTEEDKYVIQASGDPYAIDMITYVANRTDLGQPA